MLINLLLLICALCLSTVAAYYSVIGLATIFAGAFLPVVIMGGLLELSKIVLSSWLYRQWNHVPILLKTYLTSAVIILMIITSIGIFGFLSKAHIEQTGQIKENIAQIERMDADLARQKVIIEKAEEKLKQLSSIGTGSDVSIQSQIQAEQERIDNVYRRAQPIIDEQNRLIEAQTKILTDQISEIDKQNELLQRYIDTKEIAKAQSLVGTRADGDWGTGTSNAVKIWQQNKKQEKDLLLAKLEDINKNNTQVKNARDEIQKIRNRAEEQVSESNKLINRLREQVGKTKAEDVALLIAEQQELIKKSNNDIDALSGKKFQIEVQYRKLEAEVGPIKYIANFIYDTTVDKNILEKSVTWMIIVIITVFDPLAVLMIIAANLGFMLLNKPKSDLENSNTFKKKLNDELDQPVQPVYESPILKKRPDTQEDNVLTVTANVLHSINNIEIQTEDIKTHNMPNSNLSESINYDANEIIKRISNGIPISMPAMLREWNGYKH